MSRFDRFFGWSLLSWCTLLAAGCNGMLVHALVFGSWNCVAVFAAFGALCTWTAWDLAGIMGREWGSR